MGVLEERQVADDRWRMEVNKRLDEHFERLEEGDARMKEFAEQLAENTIITKRIDANTGALVKTFRAIDGFTTVGDWIIKALLRLAVVIVAAGVVYWYVKTGSLPRGE